MKQISRTGYFGKASFKIKIRKSSWVPSWDFMEEQKVKSTSGYIIYITFSFL